jgi:hypothetical protein
MNYKNSKVMKVHTWAAAKPTRKVVITNELSGWAAAKPTRKVVMTNELSGRKDSNQMWWKIVLSDGPVTLAVGLGPTITAAETDAMICLPAKYR